MKALAIITARGGSKRIPKKNIRAFCGKPIISYSIEAALQTELFDEVMVSTDNQEIAEIAIKYGAKVPFLRSEKTSNDYATTRDVILEVVECYKDLGKEFDIITCLYPTAPFVTAEKLREAIDLLKQGGADGVMPVVPFSFPPQRGFWLRDGILKVIDQESFKKRSQDLEIIYHDAGQFYCYNAEAYVRGNISFLPIIVSETEVQDIDNEDDWILAEIKYKALMSLQPEKILSPREQLHEVSTKNI